MTGPAAPHEADDNVHGQRATFRECQGCGTVWHDDETDGGGEHHYDFCPIAHPLAQETPR